MRALARLVTLAASCLVLVTTPGAAQEEEEEEPRVVPANGLSIRLEGQLQVQGSSSSVDTVPTWDSELRRARLTAIGDAGGGFSATLQTDFGQDRVRIRDALADLRVSDVVTLRGGQFKIPFNGIETISSKRLLTIERGAAIRGLRSQTTSTFLASARLSARSRGVMAIAELPTGLTIWAGGWLGSGEAAENDEGKELAARVEYELLPQSEDGGGPLVLGVAGVTNGYLGEPRDTLRVVGGDSVRVEDPLYASAFEGWVSYGTYLEPGLHAAGNVIAGENPLQPQLEEGELDLPGFLGIQGWAELLVPLQGALSGVAPVVRADRFDPDTDSGEDAVLLLTPGLNLYVGKNVKLQANLDLVVPETDEADTEAAFRLQGQVLF